MIAALNEQIESAFLDSEIGQEHLALLFFERGYLSLKLRADRQNFRALCGGDLFDREIVAVCINIVCKIVFTHVAGIYYRLRGEQGDPAGKPEVRAWTITRGTKAPQAAGKIHSDFERGFIRAEVISFDDLIACGSLTAAKEKGLVRSEGKEYVMNDGDVVLFRFNV